MPRKSPLRSDQLRDFDEFLEVASDCHAALTRLLEITHYKDLAIPLPSSQEETLPPPKPNKASPPTIPPGGTATCVRCQHAWFPYVKQPRKCPKCHMPWWYLPRWRWRRRPTKAHTG